MDIFSHGFWAGAAYKGINEFALKPKAKKQLNFWWVAFWGAFPDIFSFAIPLLGLLWNWSFRGVNLSDMPGPSSMEPPPKNILWIFNFAQYLYNLSHSAIIFLLIFGAVFLIFRRPVWELGGWFIHILIDIPTHSYQFFPTPFLWPISGVKFNGFSWATPWFLILNYSLILVVYILFRIRKR